MTAQNLFPTEATWYNNFPITNLVDNSVTDFDLFLKLGDGIVLYASNGYPFDATIKMGLYDENMNFIQNLTIEIE